MKGKRESERDRETQRERERQRDRETERDREKKEREKQGAACKPKKRAVRMCDPRWRGEVRGRWE